MSDITLRAQEYTAQKEAEAALRPKGFDHDQLMKGLYWVWDVFDRANVEFFAVKDTAKQMSKDDLLAGDHLDFGIRRLEWISGGRRLIDAFAIDNMVKEDENHAEYLYDGIPVNIFFYDEDPSLASLNTIMYFYESFKLPNPLAAFQKRFENL